jgi:hypothetical protein
MTGHSRTARHAFEQLVEHLRGARDHGRLDLYELDHREPCAYIDSGGTLLLPDGTKPQRLEPTSARTSGLAAESEDARRNTALPWRRLPAILFADVPTTLHLSAGVMVAPLHAANAMTGPIEPDPMTALLRAGDRVRGGLAAWISAAPTHIFADLLRELEADGWYLRHQTPGGLARSAAERTDDLAAGSASARASSDPSDPRTIEPSRSSSPADVPSRDAALPPGG